MAFVFTVDLSASIPTQIFRNGGDRVIMAHLGDDDCRPLSYAVVVGIAVGAGVDEYYFKLIEIDAESNEEREYWDGREVGIFISKEDRAKILQVVIRVTKLLITKERPDCFYCCTHGDNLPPHALEKYDLINKVFEECGYTVELTNSDRGRYSWWVERPGEVDC